MTAPLDLGELIAHGEVQAESDAAKHAHLGWQGAQMTAQKQAVASVAIVWNKPGRRHVALPALMNEANVSAEEALTER